MLGLIVPLIVSQLYKVASETLALLLPVACSLLPVPCSLISTVNFNESPTT
jgi:hypothetical protein